MHDVRSAVYQRAKGYSIGGSILGFFGGAWLLLGLHAWGVPWVVAAAVGIAGAAAAIGAGAAIRRRLPQMEIPETPEGRRKNRWFHIINTGQWVLILVSVNVLRNLGLGTWVVSAVALVVGLHFLPLARVFGTALHLWTGVAMMAWVAVCALMPAAVRDAAVCTGAGVVLWASVTVALRRGFELARELAAEPDAGLGLSAEAAVASGVKLPANGRSR